MVPSINTAWRWLKVPRRLSCPLRRTGVPSISKDPKASISPKAQSIPVPASTVLTRAVSWRSILGLAWNPSGMVDVLAVIALSRSALIAVATGSNEYCEVNPFQGPPNPGLGGVGEGWSWTSS